MIRNLFLAMMICSSTAFAALRVIANLPSGTVGVPYSTTLSATGAPKPYVWSITLCSGACNNGLVLSSTGVLSGTPTNAGISAYTFKVVAANGATASAVLGVTINPSTQTSLSVTTTSLPSGTVGTAYSTSLAAAGGTAPYTWSIVSCAGACNTGLGFTSTGVLSGTAANAGTSTFTFKVTDAKAASASAALGITIASPVGSSLTITTTSLPSATVNTAYSAALSASGGNPPYTWSSTCSGSCVGLSLSTAGVLSGTPTTAGTATYTFNVIDAVATTAMSTLSVAIASGGGGGTANFYVSPSGSNSNPCTQSAPCATPDHAESLAAPGNIVMVAAGTYDYGGGQAYFTTSGTASSYITVTCATRGACKLLKSSTSSAQGTVVYMAASYMTLDGFEVTSSVAPLNLGFYVTSSYVNITRNIIHHIETDCSQNGGGGIQIAGSGSSNSDLNHITIDANLIYDINGGNSCGSGVVQSDGILVETAGTGNIVTNNIVYNTSGGWGILVGNSNATNNSVNSVIANNLVFSTTGGIIVMSGNGTTISNNIVADTGAATGRCGISAPAGVSITYANNDLWNNSGGNYCLEWGTSDSSVHSGDIAVDPAAGGTFVNWQANGSGDYHERAGSPTIGAGSSIGMPNHDYDGKARTGHDIGAYQF